MAPVKPLGAKPGVTGFVQDYNQEPPPAQDLNPDAVADSSVLPKPREAAKVRKPRVSKKR